jgi:hypothetical protein
MSRLPGEQNGKAPECLIAIHVLDALRAIGERRGAAFPAKHFAPATALGRFQRWSAYGRTKAERDGVGVGERAKGKVGCFGERDLIVS